jgi:hypothetical protein
MNCSKLIGVSSKAKDSSIVTEVNYTAKVPLTENDVRAFFFQAETSFLSLLLCSSDGC